MVEIGGSVAKVHLSQVNNLLLWYSSSYFQINTTATLRKGGGKTMNNFFEEVTSLIIVQIADYNQQICTPLVVATGCTCMHSVASIFVGYCLATNGWR